ncbi:tight junction protein ZO-1-like [Monomorium pharaonis]|uniref:tight junction protein ZO-1-like n=1 Tax=Monomorium pharaonis TaxID=307658 RepID=UPI001746C103|nr:tight junction protein ZO-1-like [Monomorium pharaonis]
MSNSAVARPRFLDLSAPQGKPHFQFCSVDSDGEYPPDSDVILAEAERGRLAEPSYDDDRSVTVLSSDEHDNNLPSEPASMPPVLSSTSSTSTAFSYKIQLIRAPIRPAAAPAAIRLEPRARPLTHSSDQDIPGKILGTDDPGGSKGLLKWKGVMFAPNDEVDQDIEHDQEEDGRDTTDSVARNENFEQGSEVFMVELTRGWNSRLGFSLQPEGNRTVISVVHPDSVAAKDGRLKQGDVLLMVNEESVEHMSTADIIDLLRKIRGSIGITVMRKSKQDNIT